MRSTSAGGAVEIESVHALQLGPAAMNAPVAPEPAIGVLRKIRPAGLAPGRLPGRRPDRGGAPAGILARPRGRPVGLGGLCGGGCVTPRGLGRPLRVPALPLALRLGVLTRCVGGPDRRGAEVAAGPGMDVAQLLQLGLSNPGALREKPLEYLGAGRERSRLLHERAVPVQGLAEGGG